MDPVAKRIKELIEHEKLTNSEFAQSINTSPAIISHLLSGRNKASLQIVQSIVSKYTNVNITYLLTGDGGLYKSLTNVKETNFDQPLPKSKVDYQNEGVRLLDEPQGAPITRVSEKQNTTTTPDLFHSIESEPDQVVKEKQVEKNPESKKEKEIERIIIFYTDKSFTEYKP